MILLLVSLLVSVLMLASCQIKKLYGDFRKTNDFTDVLEAAMIAFFALFMAIFTAFAIFVIKK